MPIALGARLVQGEEFGLHGWTLRLQPPAAAIVMAAIRVDQQCVTLRSLSQSVSSPLQP
jgi:hypothetical protein